MNIAQQISDMVASKNLAVHNGQLSVSVVGYDNDVARKINH